jgi:hypothetical protein
MFKIEPMNRLRYFLLFIILVHTPELFAGKCAAGKQILWYFGESNIDAMTAEGFSDQLFKDLSFPLSSLGYCFTRYENKDSIPFSSLYRENMVMRVACKEIRENHAQEAVKNAIELIVDLININEFEKKKYEAFPDRPLVSLSFVREDMSGIRIIFEKKIIENLRTQYICNLSITSDPPGVTVNARNGLCDITPFEWVVPVGTMGIQCNLRNYITYQKEIVMERPGVYNYFLQMKKKQFYHSKFFIAGAGCGLGSAVCYYFDDFYYNRYRHLDKGDADRDPGSFERTFSTAQLFERFSISLLALSGTLIIASFWF